MVYEANPPLRLQEKGPGVEVIHQEKGLGVEVIYQEKGPGLEVICNK